MVDQSEEVKRMSDATNVAKWGMSRKSVRVTKKEESVKIQSHQMLRGV